MIITRADVDSTTVAGALFLPQRAYNLILVEKRLVVCREGERCSSLASFMCMSALLEKSESGGG